MNAFMALVFGVCGLAAAQPPADQMDNPEHSETSPAPEAVLPQENIPEEGASEQPGAAAPDQEKKEATQPMSQQALSVNFRTVVENFITARSPDGYWPLRRKTTGKLLKLRLETIKESSVRENKPGHVSGRVILSQEGESRRIQADFFVDFTGDSWAVEKLRLLPDPLPSPQAKAKKP